MSTEPIVIDSPRNGVAPQQILECINPATGQRIDELTIASTADVSAAVARARGAFPAWSALSFDRRARYLLRARDILLDRKREVLDLMVRETGKPRSDATADVLLLSAAIGYYTAHGEEYLQDESVRSTLALNKRLRVEYSPIGVVANISPWNYPLDLAWSPLIPALLAGNVVINKPSETTPLISLKFREILLEAGVPPDVAQVLIGYGAVGATLCQEVDFIAFTGSVATGRKVAMACAERLIPCTLELGGKDPAIVLADANLERTANGLVFGAFFNCGQTCTSVERVYVVEEVHDELVEKIVRLTQSLRQGIDTDYNVDVGSMIHPPQIDIVDRHINDAVEKGATVRTGGRRNPDFPEGHFYEPTVLTHVDHDMKIMVDETFGPIMPIMKVRDAEEAIGFANNSEYGLNASVWTGDIKRGRAIARRLESGNVCINDCLYNYTAPEVPFGGVKHSGIGRRHGKDELRKYCNSKTVLEDIFGLAREPVWYPYDRSTGESLLKALDVLYRRGVGRKISAVFGRRGD
jgi:succinate-semialdehyde dehydrogenase / glutarate-semialdehyde dehydrogenase